MPVPATLTSYLPVLLVSVQHNAVPDDTSFSTLPDGQVDYLSHEWREEDVWRSWRSMTRQKNAIANGMRLENASWRTWWKQRNKLKTVSPETLNWLKDSDVTWLYGPLHVGSDWIPTTHVEESMHNVQRQGSAEAMSSLRKATPMKKPILKRRSISQLLSLPGGHWFDQGDISDEEAAELAHGGDDFSAVPQRPPLLHTKSDTHISSRGRVPSSPQTEATVALGSTATSSDVSNSTGSDQDSSGSSTVGGKKRHISFNTFVEQCIAIEKPKKRPSHPGSREPRVASFDDGYEEDSELGYDEYEEPPSFYVGTPGSANSDSEDDEDDVLEMRTSSSRARTSPGVQRFNHSPEASLLSPRFRPPLVRRSSTGGERGVTIAPIAPTILKSTGVGNQVTANARGIRPVPKEVELVYVPPSNSNYSLPGTPTITSEEVYHHRESYFSVGTSDLPSQYPSASSPRIPSAAVLPPPPQIPIAVPAPRSASRRPPSPAFFPRQAVSESPMTEDIGDAESEDTYHHFEGQDLDDHYSEWTPLNDSRERSMADQRDGGATGSPRFAEGGAASVTNGRSSGDDDHFGRSPSLSPEMPVVVVNEANGATEERTERSRESSPSFADLSGGAVPYSRTPESMDCPPDLPTFIHSSPSTPAVPVPRIGTSHPLISFSPQIANATLLSPTDLGSFRGRPPACPSVSGSTTTGSSYSRSTDSRSESRGRSLTRNSSCSDHERSGSRSSRGTNSPLGSISPTGSSLGVGSAHSGQARGGSKSAARSGRKGDDEVERGRERSGRRLGGSVSPPSLLNSPSSPASDVGEFQSYSPVLAVDESLASSPPSSISGSSTASVSTIGPSKPQQTPQPEVISPRPRIVVPSSSSPSSIPSLSHPSPIAEEDEQRSRNPTPASSPISALHPAVLSPRSEKAVEKPKFPESPSSPISLPMASADSPTAASRHKVRGSLDLVQDQGTIVGQMVSSARGFLGAIWSSGTA
ncbi:hypothetical protein B0H21DRAFT_719234 [Amylocystis lapponica]|nr:hypothetical protein B0H21DRAFT_719234 [Amylocystis lapponica]